MAGDGDAAFRTLTRRYDQDLASRGFERDGRRAFWRRHTRELEHAVAILRRRGSADVQWAIIVPEATPFLWGVDHPDRDIGHHVIAGTPGSIRHPAAAQSFVVSELADEAYAHAAAAGLAQDVAVMDEYLAQFQTRSSVRDHLLQAVDAWPDRQFVIPARGLVFFTAAVLAVIDRDGMAADLAVRAIDDLSRHRGAISDGRRARLREALARLK